MARKYDAPALRKGIEVIETIAASAKPVGITELAEAVKSNPHMITRILHTLVNMGWVIEEDGRKYSLGLRGFHHTSKPVGRLDLRKAGWGPLHKLWQETGECVHISRLDGDEYILIEALETTAHLARVTPAPGLRGVLYSNAPGKMLLAHAPRSLQKRVLKGRLTKQGPKTITDPALLARELEKIRRQGFSMDNEEDVEGVVCVAAPVRDHTGTVVGAVCTTALRMYYTVGSLSREMGPKVIRCAEEISKILGSMNGDGDA